MTLETILSKINAGLAKLPPKLEKVDEGPPVAIPIPTLTVEEKIWYNYIPVILQGAGLLFRGTVVGNVADLLSQLKGTTDMDTKPWYTSKTFWTNVIGAFWITVGPTLGLPTLDTNTEVLILGALNVILRLITKTAVTIS